MACWEDTMVITLRAVINDLGEDPQYAEDHLKQLLVASALIVSMSIDFDTQYAIDVSGISITPDPSADKAFVSLVVLKAACFLAMAAQKDAANKGVSVKDGPSNIDGRGRADATAKWSDKVCKDYTTAEMAAKTGNMAVGQAIISPYRWDGSDQQAHHTHRSSGYDSGEYFS